MVCDKSSKQSELYITHGATDGTVHREYFATSNVAWCEKKLELICPKEAQTLHGAICYDVKIEPTPLSDRYRLALSHSFCYVVITIFLTHEGCRVEMLLSKIPKQLSGPKVNVRCHLNLFNYKMWRTWRDTFAEDMRKMGVSGSGIHDEARSVASDRARWKQLVAQCSRRDRRT